MTIGYGFFRTVVQTRKRKQTARGVVGYPFGLAATTHLPVRMVPRDP